MVHQSLKQNKLCTPALNEEFRVESFQTLGALVEISRINSGLLDIYSTKTKTIHLSNVKIRNKKKLIKNYCIIIGEME